MKKYIVFLSLIVIGFSIYFLQPAGKTEGAEIRIEKSNKFSEEEINKAVDTVKRNFKSFDGCQLTDLWYSENDSDKIVDDYLTAGAGSENGVKKDNVIVLFSNFTVDSSGARQGFNPNSTYTDWNWLLIRDGKNGKWQVDTWGY